jgi:hypothetical protein
MLQTFLIDLPGSQKPIDQKMDSYGQPHDTKNKDFVSHPKGVILPPKRGDFNNSFSLTDPAFLEANRVELPGG